MENSVYQLTVNAAIETFVDGALILDLKKLAYFELNTTARDVLELSDGNRTVRQVAQILGEEYEIDSQQALQDVSELYHNLSKKRIVELVKPAAKKES
jgi:hypothetical protein